MRIRLPKATAGDPPELLDAHPLALQALAAALQPPLLVQLATGAQLAASRMLCFRGAHESPNCAGADASRQAALAPRAGGIIVRGACGGAQKVSIQLH